MKRWLATRGALAASPTDDVRVFHWGFSMIVKTMPHYCFSEHARAVYSSSPIVFESAQTRSFTNPLSKSGHLLKINHIFSTGMNHEQLEFFATWRISTPKKFSNISHRRSIYFFFGIFLWCGNSRKLQKPVLKISPQKIAFFSVNVRIHQNPGSELVNDLRRYPQTFFFSVSTSSS